MLIIYVYIFSGKPWLWARLDRKPNKSSDKKFKKFHNQKQQWLRDGKQGSEPTFQWNVLTDFKVRYILMLGIVKYT